MFADVNVFGPTRTHLGIKLEFGMRRAKNIFMSKNINSITIIIILEAFFMEARSRFVVRGEISLTGINISPYKHSQAGWSAAGMKVQRCRRKLFLTTVKATKHQFIVKTTFIPLTGLSC